MAANTKLVTVFGATGSQGGSVVNAVLSGGYKVRGVTRHPDKADQLRQKGVDVVKGDIAVDSVDQLANVMKGSYGAFLLTNFWDPSSMMKEFEQGKKIVDAAHKAGVKHVFWSTLSNVEKVAKGKYNVPHFTDKAKVEEYIRELQQKTPKAFEHATFLSPAFYYQNFQLFFPPKLEGDTYVFTLPETKILIAYDVQETGAPVLAALNNPKKYDGVRIDYYGDSGHPQQYIDTWARITGKKAKLNLLPHDVYAKLPFPGAHELADMFGYFNEFTYYGPEGNAKSGQEATPGGLTKYEPFLKKTGWKFEDKK